MKQWTLLLGLALVAAPAAAHAQQNGNGTRAQGPRAGAMRGAPGRMMAADPLRFLVAHSSDLKLTPAQLEQIRTRQAKLEAANKPLVAKLREGRGQRPQAQPSQEEREAMRARMEKLRPTMQQLRKNSQDAWKDAQSYLTKEQLQQVKTLRQDRAGAQQARMKARQDRMNQRQERMKERQQQGK
jgi:hypothetical protein